MEKVTAEWQGDLMSVEKDQEQNDEQQILALHEAGDKALMSADLEFWRRFCRRLRAVQRVSKAFTKQMY